MLLGRRGGGGIGVGGKEGGWDWMGTGWQRGGERFVSCHVEWWTSERGQPEGIGKRGGGEGGEWRGWGWLGWWGWW